jgi:hypothetical protein
VRNAQGAGQVTLSRGRHTETMAIAERGPEAAAPVLKQYVTELPITRPFFDATPDAPLEAFVAEAHRLPVFRIHGASASSIRSMPWDEAKGSAPDAPYPPTALLQPLA